MGYFNTTTLCLTIKMSFVAEKFKSVNYQENYHTNEEKEGIFGEKELLTQL